jgi:DNA-3-methyladenine glycosylase II
VTFRSLDEVSLRRAVRTLARRDPALAAIAREYGPPPLWAREPGFATLVHMILEQQVSLASARAVFERLRATLPVFDAASLLALDETVFKQVGITRQKTAYARGLAQAIACRALDLDALASLQDIDVHAALTRVKGIGLWTSNVYLLMALGRPDAFPASDIALQVAAHKVLRLRKRPTAERLERLAEQWRPWRAVAARLLWHFYLSEKARMRLKPRPARLPAGTRTPRRSRAVAGECT